MKKIIGLLVVIGSIAWSLTMVKSGWQYSYGLGFWGANGHDGIWHIALANQLTKGSLENPVFAGESIKNYHLGFDAFLAFLSKITFIPVVNLYFQILPVIFSILAGLLTYLFVRNWTKSKLSAVLSTFFVYFGASLGWLLGRGESTFWASQAISTLINPPFALSLILILLGLICLQKNRIWLSVLCFGVLVQVKIYAGLLILGGLFVSGVYELLVNNKNYKLLKIFVLTLLLSLVVYLPLNKLSANLIQFQPFWFLETMMGYPDRLDWQRFYSAMTTYKMGNIWLKGIAAYLVAFGVFVAGNFWTRLLFLKGVFKKVDGIKVLILSVILAGTLIPTFFVQSGTPWNTIQFMYYSLFFGGILAGISLSNLNRKYVVYGVLFLTIPTTILTLKDVYIPGRPPAALPNNEIEALNFLKNQPDGIVLTYPFDRNLAKEAENNPPRPLYLYESTAYVSAFSEKTVFLEDEVNLNITGYDWQERRNKVTNWYKEKDQEKARQFLKENIIKYIYWIKPQRTLLDEGQLGLEKIFENKEVIIYRYE